jgi:hypothetical protein
MSVPDLNSPAVRTRGTSWHVAAPNYRLVLSGFPGYRGPRSDAALYERLGPASHRSGRSPRVRRRANPSMNGEAGSVRGEQSGPSIADGSSVGDGPLRRPDGLLASRSYSVEGKGAASPRDAPESFPKLLTATVQHAGQLVSESVKTTSNHA